MMTTSCYLNACDTAAKSPTSRTKFEAAASNSPAAEPLLTRGPLEGSLDPVPLLPCWVGCN